MAKYVGVSGTPPEKKPTSVFGPADTGVNIYDDEGNVITNVPYGENGIYGVGETVYKGTNSEGKEIWSADTYDFAPSITLDDVTGEIKIRAPQAFLDSDVYTQYFDDDIIRGLGRLYVQNKDAKLQMADGTEKTVKEIIESWNNDLPKLVKAQESFAKMKEGAGNKFGEEAKNNFTLETYQLAGTSAYSGRDDDYLVLPNSILNSSNWSFLKDLEGLDKETGFITKKDFSDGYYHLDALRDLYSESPTSISRLKKDVARAIQNFEGSDMTEYAKLIAFNNFLSGEAAEGASNTPKGDLLNKVTIDAHAFYEAFYRATAATANNFVNNLGSLALAPFSVVDWIGGKTEGYQPKFIIDEMVGVTGDVIGDNLIPGAETVAEFLENEKNRRGDIYALTDSTASLIYNLSYMGTYAVETVLQSVAKTRLLVNGVTLGITGTSVARGIPKATEAIQRMGMLGAKTADDEILWTTTAQEAVKANSAMVSGGVSQPVADLLTGMGGYSTWDKINLIGSLNPAELINGAFLYNQYIGQVGEDLAIIGGAGKAGAAGYEQAYAEMLKRNASMWMAQGKWGDINTTAEKIAYLKYLQPKFEAIYNTGNTLLQTAAKVVTVLNGYAKYMPSVYYVSQVLIGTALSESDSIRRLMQSSDSNEQRELLWGMIGRTALGWTIGMVVGRVVNKVFNGDFDQAIESANLGATEKIAKGVTAVRDRIDQFHMLVHGGKDWVDSINNPVKKSVIKFNQSLAKSQKYMANAADMVRAEGGTEIAARAATKTAIDQYKANQNAIDLMQNPEWQVASWHTDAYPAYNNASNVFTGLTNDVSKMLTDLGLNVGVKPTAIIGGVATNADLPQEVVNYMARALQRASYLRDDFDVSNVLVPIGQSIANIQSQYKIVDPRLIKERDIAKKVMAEFEGKYPKALVDLIKNKWVPAAQNAAYQLNQSIIGTGYYLRSQEEGWRKSGMWGQNNELWFPLQRVTDAQKDFEEAARNPMQVIKSGAIRRRSTDPKHLAPGSDEMTDFVHPMTTWKMHEFQTAVDLSVRNWVHVNLTNPFIKHVTKLDGAQVGAAVTYDDLEPHYEKSVLRSLSATKQKLDESGLVNDMVDKQKMETRLKHAKKAVADAKKTWENIPNVDVKITNAARSRTIDTLPEEVVDGYLDKLGVPFEGEKVDIRKWLNNKMKMSDILNWDLLGRTHTNGLFPGGLYTEMQAETKAYSMDIDVLMDLLGISDISVEYREALLDSFGEKTAGKYKGAVIPVSEVQNSLDGPQFSFYPRGGVSFGNTHSAPNDRELKAYLDYLKEMGVDKVPVAISSGDNLAEHRKAANITRTLRDLGIADEGLNNVVGAVDKAIATGKNPVFKVRDLAAALHVPGYDRDWLFRKIRKSIPESPDPEYGGSFISDEKLNKLIDKAEKYDWEKDKKIGKMLSSKSLPEAINDRLVRNAKVESAKSVVDKMNYADRKKLAALLAKADSHLANPYVVLYSIPKKDTSWTKGDKVFTSDERMAKRLAKGYNGGIEDTEIIVIPRRYISTWPMASNIYEKDPDLLNKNEVIADMLSYGYRAALVSGDINEDVLKKRDGKMAFIDDIYPAVGGQKIKNSVIIMYDDHYPEARESSLDALANMYVAEHGDEISAESPLESGSVTDITDEMTQAMAEYGKLPLYHSQREPLGSIEFNNAPPTGEGRYTANQGIGDALWISPNSSYTDEYGPNKVIADIPFEYFMTDKEMKDVAKALAQKLAPIEEKIDQSVKKEVAAEDEKLLKSLSRETQTLELMDDLLPLGDPITLPSSDVLYDSVSWPDSDVYSAKYGKGKYLVDNLHTVYKMNVASENKKKGILHKYTFEPINEVSHTPSEEYAHRSKAIEKLSKKDRKEYDKISKIIYPSGDVRSYRALAEYTGKPVIDTTRDMMRQGITGTAHFYYKDVNPEFDQKIGSQLASQVIFQGDNIEPRLSREQIDGALEKWDGTKIETLLELADKVTNLNSTNAFNIELEDYKNGKMPSQEFVDAVEIIAKDISKNGAPGIASTIGQILNSPKQLDPYDMRFSAFDSSTGYTTIDDDSAEAFLKEVDDSVFDELDNEPSESQLSFGDYMDQMANEIPAYTEQDLADIRLRDLERKRKILKKELKELCK